MNSSSRIWHRLLGICLTLSPLLLVMSSVNACIPEEHIPPDKCLIFDWATSPSGDQLAVAGDQLVVYDAATGNPVRTIREFTPWGRSVNNLHWIDSNTLCAWSSERQCPVCINVVDGSIRDLVKSRRVTEQVGPAYFSPDGQRFSCLVATLDAAGHVDALSVAIYSIDGSQQNSVPVSRNFVGWRYRRHAWSGDSTHLYIPCPSESQYVDVIDIDTSSMTAKSILTIEMLPANIAYRSMGDYIYYDHGRLIVDGGETCDTYIIDIINHKTRIIASNVSEKRRPPVLFMRGDLSCAFMWGETYEGNSIVILGGKPGERNQTAWTGPVVQCHWGREGCLEFITMGPNGVAGLYSLDIRSRISRQLISEASLRQTIRPIDAEGDTP